MFTRQKGEQEKQANSVKMLKVKKRIRGKKERKKDEEHKCNNKNVTKTNNKTEEKKI